MKFKLYVRQKDNPRSRWTLWAAFSLELDRVRFENDLLMKNPTWEIAYNYQSVIVRRHI
jgi:hypothetical protein